MTGNINKVPDRLTSWGGVDITADNIDYLESKIVVGSSDEDDESLTPLSQTNIDDDTKLGVNWKVDGSEYGSDKLKNFHEIGITDGTKDIADRYKKARRAANNIKI